MEACDPKTTMCMPEGQPEDVITGPKHPPTTPPPAPTGADKSAKPTDPAAQPPRDRDIISFERGDPSAMSAPTKGDLVKTAVIKGLQEGALNVVDPLHVNRNFVKDISVAVDGNASTASRGIAGGSAVLAVVPVIGELKLAPADLNPIEQLFSRIKHAMRTAMADPNMPPTKRWPKRSRQSRHPNAQTTSRTQYICQPKCKTL